MSADPQIWYELKNTVITLIFETGDNSRDSLYAIKSLKKKMKISVL
jgi:hypothetical protein